MDLNHTQSPAESGFEKCPDLETVAAFIDGNLGEVERKPFLTHLDQCESCRELVSETARMLAEMDGGETVSTSPEPPVATAGISIAEKSKSSSLESYGSKSAPHGRRWLPLAAMAAMFLIAFVGLSWPPSGPSLDRRMSESFAKLKSNNEPHRLLLDQVFNDLLPFAGLESTSSLRVVEGDFSELAWSDPKNNRIYLSMDGLRTILKPDSEDERKSQLAYVLAHELAHLRDATRPHAFYTYRERVNPLRKLALRGVGAARLKTIERDADARALHWMIGAGYQTDVLFSQEDSLLDDWADVLTARGMRPDKSTHAQRVQALENDLQELLPFAYQWQVANRLLQLGRQDVAIVLYENILENIELPEVHNNLAIAHYQNAMGSLAACEGALVMRYKLPLTVEQETLASRRVNRGNTDSPCFEGEQFTSHWLNAKASWEEAIRLAPGKLNYKRNLQAASLLATPPGNGELLEAPSSDKDELTLLGEFGVFEGLRNYDLAEVNDILDQLKTLAEAAEAASSTVYNAANCHWLAGRQDEAVSLYRKFLSMEPRSVYSDYIRERLRLEPIMPPASVAFDVSLPIAIGPLDEVGRAALATWSLVSDPGWPVEGLNLYRKDESLLLVLGEDVVYVEMNASESLAMPDFAPTSEWQISAGSFKIYDRAAVQIFDGNPIKIVFFQ